MNSMNPRITKTNIKAFKALGDESVPFGRKIDTMKALKAWKQDEQTRRVWLSQKRQSLTKALKELKDMYDAREFYVELGKNDDSFEAFYRR
jgi:trehalose utilization protein